MQRSDHSLQDPVKLFQCFFFSRTGDIIEPLLKRQWFMRCDRMAERAMQVSLCGNSIEAELQMLVYLRPPTRPWKTESCRSSPRTTQKHGRTGCPTSGRAVDLSWIWADDGLKNSVCFCSAVTGAYPDSCGGAIRSLLTKFRLWVLPANSRYVCMCLGHLDKCESFRLWVLMRWCRSSGCGGAVKKRPEDERPADME